MLDRISRSDATALLRHCLEDGILEPGKHFRKELAAEGLTILESNHVLKSGTIYDEPEPDGKTGEWKYRVEGHEPGGKWLVIVFTFREVNHVFLITVFSVESRSRK
jgi:Domain of unknown function (DUF4258)